MGLLSTSKATLRKQIKEKLTTLSEDEKKRQSDIIVRKLLQLPVFKTSRRISVFLSTENEVDTEPIVKKIFEENKECFVPRYQKKGMEMVKLYTMADWESLPLTKWKIKQPKLSEDREDALKTGGLDLIVVPGVAFNSKGLRLGHGAGYYDRYLNHIKSIQIHPPKTIGIAFKEQIVSEVPVCEHDVPVDIVLTCDGYSLQST